MPALLKLALVRQRYTPYGGAERFIARALPALDRAGIEVSLIARRWNGWGARRVIKVDPFYVGSTWRDASFARAARDEWRRHAFDIVQSHERIPGCDVYRAGDGVHRRWLDIRLEHAGAAERLGILASPYHRYVCDAERQMFEHPRLRAVICNSRMVSEEVLHGFRIAPERLHVIYNGVDLEHFGTAGREAARGSTRSSLGLGTRETAFLFVGSGFKRKGLDTAIDALARAANPAFHLYVVGRDRRGAALAGRARRAGLAERVHFLGPCDDVRPYYAAADCLVLPTRYDPFPNTVLEALAMGLPAIVSRRCGAAEIIEPGVNGWICAPDDADGLARLMREADQALRDPKLGARARASAEAFGMDAMAARLLELYRTLASDERA